MRSSDWSSDVCSSDLSVAAEAVGGCSLWLASVKYGPLWQFAQPFALNRTFPRCAWAWLKLPSGGGGAGIDSWYACNAASTSLTLSCLPFATTMPGRQSDARPGVPGSRWEPTRGSEKTPRKSTRLNSSYRAPYARLGPSP